VQPAELRTTEVQLTRNGLVKRPRPAAAGTPVVVPPAASLPASSPAATAESAAAAFNTTTPGTPFTPPVYPEPITERSPEEVRTMLSQFRSGHQRGKRTSSDQSSAGDSGDTGVSAVATAGRSLDTEEETR
jgi:hypothetical protein